MKIIYAAMLPLLITGTHALASTSGGNAEGMGLLVRFFIAFGVLIILFQFIPGITLFWSMVKGIFSSEVKKPARAVEVGRTTP